MEWHLEQFDALHPNILYGILRLRNEVFVVEQNCVFQDADMKDPECLHLWAGQAGEILAYCRIVPPGLSYKEPSIGRIVTASSIRKSGIGKLLVLKAIACCREKFQGAPIRIGAQFYLRKFYESFGFQIDGGKYLEDGIEHIEMILHPPQRDFNTI